MKERPILFSAPMVRAILDGRKTQTRRVVKPQPEATEHGFMWPSNLARSMVEVRDMGSLGPYGGRGDRLWVRETWQRLTNNGIRIVYRADGEDPRTGWDDVPAESRPKMTWQPSIFLRRADSRISLGIERVRVERLHDLTADAARAEGVTVGEPVPTTINGKPGQVTYFDPVVAFCHLWCAINGRDSWAANPWVWVIEFQRVTPNASRAPEEKTK